MTSRTTEAQLSLPAQSTATAKKAIPHNATAMPKARRGPRLATTHQPPTMAAMMPMNAMTSAPAFRTTNTMTKTANAALASSAVEANTCARRDVLPPPCAGASPSGSYSEVPDNVGLLTPDVTPHPRCIRVSAKGHAAGR